MTPLVVDASVLLKWVLPEVHSEAARHVLSASDLLAPDLLWAEVGHVLWRRRRQGEFDAQTAQVMLLDLRSLEIRDFPVRPLLPAALNIAMSIDHALYAAHLAAGGRPGGGGDCIYLALAEDAGLHRRYRRSAVPSKVRNGILSDRIAWIEDLA